MKRIPSLDGWRAVAIGMVLVDHLTANYRFQGDHILRLGPTGVAFFFALSGFLITTRLLEEKERDGKINLKDFYLRRVFRLVPASLIYLTVLAALTTFGVIAMTRTQWLGSLLFFRNYIPMGFESGGWYTQHFWSLAVEEHFYLIWPSLLILSRANWKVPASFALLVSTWRFIDPRYHVVGLEAWGIPARTDLRLDGLLWGCVLAIALSDMRFREWIQRHYSLGLWFLAGAAYAASQLIGGHHNYSPYEPVLIVAIIVWPVLNAHSVIGRVLDWNVLRWIGRLSYSLYVWQQLWVILPGVSVTLGQLQRFPFNILCIFLSASLSYYLIEKPMVELGHWVTGRKLIGGKYDSGKLSHQLAYVLGKVSSSRENRQNWATTLLPQGKAGNRD
jgi:peptidoglycan/LPS O-acetylase OafA/YrhL